MLTSGNSDITPKALGVVLSDGRVGQTEFEIPESTKVENGYFSYCRDSGFEEHDTEEEAIKAANDSINFFRDTAEEGWDEAVTEVKWGIVEQHTIGTEEMTAEQAKEYGIPMSADCSKWVNYGLRNVESSEGVASNVIEFSVGDVILLDSLLKYKEVGLYMEGSYEVVYNAVPGVSTVTFVKDVTITLVSEVK